jgi:hypothetical protein
MAITTVAAPSQTGTGSRWYSTATVLAGVSTALLGALHIAAGLQYLSFTTAYSAFFFVVAPIQLLYGLTLVGRVRSAKSTGVLLAALIGTLALVALWLFVHIGWQPLFRPSDGPEALSQINVFAFGLELLAAISLLFVLPTANNLRRNAIWTVGGLALVGWLTLLVVGFF